MPKRGLPETLRMRHDEHYVEALAASAGEPVGRLVPIELLDPNPNQPRQVMGDLAELMASVAEKGIIEPLIVRQRGARYQIIAGERRYHAASQAGLQELPVVIRDVDDRTLLVLALASAGCSGDAAPIADATPPDAGWEDQVVVLETFDVSAFHGDLVDGEPTIDVAFYVTEGGPITWPSRYWPNV